MVGLYRENAKTPIPVAGEIFGKNKNSRSLRINWKMRDMDKLEFGSFIKLYSVNYRNDEIENIIPVGDPLDVSNE